MASQAIIANQRAAGGGSTPSGPSLDNAKAIMDSFTYTGEMLQDVKFMDGNPYVLLTFETSGVLTVDGEYTGDVWLCGGGGGGAHMRSSSAPSYGPGGGGGGGFTTNCFGVAVESGTITIGSGGAGHTGSSVATINSSGRGGSTTYLTYAAAGGGGGTGHGTQDTTTGNPVLAYADGGSGGGAPLFVDAASHTVSTTRIRAGTGQGKTTRPFESLEMPPYCAGGGAGTAGPSSDFSGTYYGGCGGSDGSGGTQANTSIPGTGGYRSGGDGALNASTPPTAGWQYGGGGGGGGYMSGGGNVDRGANGFPGAVMIRIRL